MAVAPAFTHVAACTLALSPIRDTLIEGFSHFVTSMTAPIASGRSDIAGWDLHPLENAAFPRRTPITGHRSGFRLSWDDGTVGLKQADRLR